MGKVADAPLTEHGSSSAPSAMETGKKSFRAESTCYEGSLDPWPAPTKNCRPPTRPSSAASRPSWARIVAESWSSSIENGTKHVAHTAAVDHGAARASASRPPHLRVRGVPGRAMMNAGGNAPGSLDGSLEGSLRRSSDEPARAGDPAAGLGPSATSATSERTSAPAANHASTGWPWGRAIGSNRRQERRDPRGGLSRRPPAQERSVRTPRSSTWPGLPDVALTQDPWASGKAPPVPPRSLPPSTPPSTPLQVGTRPSLGEYAWSPAESTR